jgi:hypothetical protein
LTGYTGGLTCQVPGGVADVLHLSWPCQGTDAADPVSHARTQLRPG